MAIFTSFGKNFEITEISFAPNIITIDEETAYTFKIKNVSGKKISAMYAQMKLYYRATDGKVYGSNAMFVYGGPTYDLKSISWASGSTKSFTGKFIFSPVAAYPPDIDTRLLPLFKGSDAGYSESFGGNERLGLFLNITTNATFGDGSNTDSFFDLRGENSAYLSVIDARYNPSITTFAAERSNGAEANDEGENLLANIALTKSAAARPEFMQLYLYYRDKARPDTDPYSVTLTSLIPSALAAEIRTVISEILGKNSDWDLVLWFGDKYESTTSTIEVSRSFANVHISGASTGGVCFGSFSKSTEGNPLFECYYPARFFGGIHGVSNYQEGEVKTGGTWIDGKPIYRKAVHVDITSLNINYTVANIGVNVDSLISIGGILVRDGNTQWPPNYYVSDTSYCSVWLNATDGSIRAKTSAAHSGYLVFEYTKVTEEVSDNALD